MLVLLLFLISAVGTALLWLSVFTLATELYNDLKPSGLLASLWLPVKILFCGFVVLMLLSAIFCTYGVYQMFLML